MRVAPVPLYNTFSDVLRFCNALFVALDADTTEDNVDGEY